VTLARDTTARSACRERGEQLMHLTYHDHDVECAGQASADETEITPAMIEAGVRELASYEPGWDCGSDVVRDIYMAMEKARQVVAARPSSGDAFL
jgi:hypothetical protein